MQQREKNVIRFGIAVIIACVLLLSGLVVSLAVRTQRLASEASASGGGNIAATAFASESGEMHDFVILTVKNEATEETTEERILYRSYSEFCEATGFPINNPSLANMRGYIWAASAPESVSDWNYVGSSWSVQPKIVQPGGGLIIYILDKDHDYIFTYQYQYTGQKIPIRFSYMKQEGIFETKIVPTIPGRMPEAPELPVLDYYIFSHWDQEIVAASAEILYTAVYLENEIPNTGTHYINVNGERVGIEKHDPKDNICPTCGKSIEDIISGGNGGVHSDYWYMFHVDFSGDMPTRSDYQYNLEWYMDSYLYLTDVGGCAMFIFIANEPEGGYINYAQHEIKKSYLYLNSGIFDADYRVMGGYYENNGDPFFEYYFCVADLYDFMLLHGWEDTYRRGVFYFKMPPMPDGWKLMIANTLQTSEEAPDGFFQSYHNYIEDYKLVDPNPVRIRHYTDQEGDFALTFSMAAVERSEFDFWTGAQWTIDALSEFFGIMAKPIYDTAKDVAGGVADVVTKVAKDVLNSFFDVFATAWNRLPLWVQIGIIIVAVVLVIALLIRIVKFIRNT